MKIKLLFVTLLTSLLVVPAMASTVVEKNKPVVKKGWNVGPLPAVSYNADKGFQMGALLNLYDYGDGSYYPNPVQHWYFEGSYYTKGTQFYKIAYDARKLIPGVRVSANAVVNYDKAADFYGFNGYMSYYDYARVAEGNDKTSDAYSYTPFYRMQRLSVNFKADFTGNIWKNKLFWEAGYNFYYIETNPINRAAINKGKAENKVFPDDQPTLFEQYQKWGIIDEDEAKGGFDSAIRLGLMYDTRNKEGAPSKGIWAEGHVIGSPKFLGSTNPYYKYSLTFRHYVPIIKNDKLTFAYRLNYQGTIGKSAPFYVLPILTNMGKENDKEGFGGNRSIRGLMLYRLQGLDMGLYNIELRWRFASFVLWNQNIALALNGFTDGGMVFRNYDMSYKANPYDIPLRQSYNKYIESAEPYVSASGNDKLHLTYGGGFRFIMNENFIVYAEYGVPLSKQDGKGSLYISIGYLF